ncbi:MAG: CvpA family protein [Treponema sp.]|nr:CvpA family protein [Treponema sp.]
MTFSFIDFVFIGLIVLLMIRCYIRGFISEVLTMAGFVFGLYAALFFYSNFGEFIRSTFMPDTEIIPEVIAFISLFIIVFIIVKVLEKMLKDIIKAVHLGKADSIIGLAFGLAEGIILVSLILFLLDIQTAFETDSFLMNSFFANLLLPLITGNNFIPLVINITNPAGDSGV